MSPSAGRLIQSSPLALLGTNRAPFEQGPEGHGGLVMIEIQLSPWALLENNRAPFCMIDIQLSPKALLDPFRAPFAQGPGWHGGRVMIEIQSSPQESGVMSSPLLSKVQGGTAVG
jgi:hypothetical protein